MKDFIIRQVDGYGWLPIIIQDGKEVYRGEFQQTPILAMCKALDFSERLEDERAS